MIPLCRCFECKPSFCLMKMKIMPEPAMATSAMTPAKKPKADKSKKEGTGGIVDKLASYSHKLQWLLQTFEYWIADYITHLSK